MKQIPVFRQGKLILYTAPQEASHQWSRDQLFHAASAYATALTKGYSEELAHSLAEIWVNKEIYPEIQYNESLEKKLKTLMDHEGTT